VQGRETVSRTLGQVQFQLRKTPNGAGADASWLLDAINDRYEALLSAHPWTRLRLDFPLTVPAKYNTGTITVVNGSQSITGSGTTWTSAMQDRFTRIAGRSEMYLFTFSSTVAATLDAAYEGDDGSGVAYEILQNVYQLPADFGQLDSITVPYTDAELDQISTEELDLLDPARLQYGRPEVFAPYSDDAGFIQRVELWPVPDTAETYRARGKRKVARLQSSNESFLPWIDPTAIVAGVEADLCRIKGDYTGAQLNEARYDRALLAMKNEDNRLMPASRMEMAERFTNHRVDRAYGGNRRYDRWAQLRRSN
jgi:hypothetical protein